MRRKRPDRIAWQSKLIDSYLFCLRKGNLQEILELFTPDAAVVSPLYGTGPATRFYRDLFKDTSRSVIQLQTVYHGRSETEGAAALFTYTWTLVSGKRVVFDCVDVFTFDNRKKRISLLQIIYDTAAIRREFNRLSHHSG